jgi:heme-degrading monooxygenase HmoA
MTTVLCFCQVADYDAWRAGYAHALEVTPGVRSFRVWRGVDDPNFVAVEETFDTREEAITAWTSPETEQGMIADGIDMATVRIEYLDEVDAGTL